MANKVNHLLSLNHDALESDEKRIVIRKLVSVMQSRTLEATATDLARLGWLYLHLRDPEKAREVASAGLVLEPGNEHCSNVIERAERKRFTRA